MVEQITNRYDIIHLLDAGGMGRVYQVHDRLKDVTLALKRIHQFARMVANGTSAEMMRLKLGLTNEFKILSAIRHPYIIAVYDFGFDEKDTPFFTMDLVEKSRKIDTVFANSENSQRVRLLIQILQALAYLHRHAIIHRDLKPSNILIDEQNMVKLVDFGISAMIGYISKAAGTPFYLAPETLLNRPPTPATDLYSFGVIAYELFTGRHPYRIDTESGTPVWGFEVESMDGVPEWFNFSTPTEDSPSLQQIIARLVNIDKEKRYQQAEDVIRDLNIVNGTPLPRESVAIRESYLKAAKFVGRDAELNLLESALLRLSLGAGSTWLIGGESGVGKSRLCAEIISRAMVSGVLVLRVQGHETISNQFTIWDDALRLLMLHSAITDEQELLYRKLRAQTASPGDLLRLLSSLIERYHNPILLLIDDLQWTHHSFDLLQQLSQKQPDFLMILANYQSQYLPDTESLFPNAKHLNLTPLDAGGIEALSQAMLGEQGTQPQILNRLSEESGGNIYLALEMIRAYAEESGSLAAIGTQDVDILAGETALLRRRLQRVPQWANFGLQIAAVAGRELDLRLLAEPLEPMLATAHLTFDKNASTFSTLFKNKTHFTLEDWLMICANGAVLEVQNDRWRFAHDKLRQQMLADMAAGTRQQIEKVLTQRREELTSE